MSENTLDSATLRRDLNFEFKQQLAKINFNSKINNAQNCALNGRIEIHLPECEVLNSFPIALWELQAFSNKHNSSNQTLATYGGSLPASRHTNFVDVTTRLASPYWKLRSPNSAQSPNLKFNELIKQVDSK